jgi:hypothetical protein
LAVALQQLHLGIQYFHLNSYFQQQEYFDYCLVLLPKIQTLALAQFLICLSHFELHPEIYLLIHPNPCCFRLIKSPCYYHFQVVEASSTFALLIASFQLQSLLESFKVPEASLDQVFQEQLLLAELLQQLFLPFEFTHHLSCPPYFHLLVFALLYLFYHHQLASQHSFHLLCYFLSSLLHFDFDFRFIFLILFPFHFQC